MSESGEVVHELLGQHLLLLPEKAIFWNEKQILIVADVHVGKVGHFRKAGIAIPKILEQEDLAALSDLITKYKPKQLVFLGDLFHSEMNNDWEWLRLWRELYIETEMVLVLGNHDILHDDHYKSVNFKVVSDYVLSPFLFTHEPKEIEQDLYVISGHIHPGIVLNGKGRQKFSLCCFYFNAKQAVLPAFGKFTGKYLVDLKKEDKIFGVLKDKVVCL